MDQGRAHRQAARESTSGQGWGAPASS